MMAENSRPTHATLATLLSAMIAFWICSSSPRTAHDADLGAGLVLQHATCGW
jgi:hypothetical protein